MTMCSPIAVAAMPDGSWRLMAWTGPLARAPDAGARADRGTITALPPTITGPRVDADPLALAVAIWLLCRDDALPGAAGPRALALCTVSVGAGAGPRALALCTASVGAGAVAPVGLIVVGLGVVPSDGLTIVR